MRSIKYFLKIWAAAFVLLATPSFAATFGSVSDGWTLDTATGELRILTDAGMSAWRDTTKTTAIKNGTRTCYIAPEVTKILPNAFKDMASLKTVTGADGVAAIGGCAFMNCAELVSMPAMPKLTALTVGEIYETRGQTFSNCAKLETTGFLKHVTHLPISSFEGCASIKYVEVSSAIEIVGRKAFKDSGIERFDVVSTGSYLSFQNNIFEGCASLKEIYLKAPSVTMTMEGTLDGCTSLRKLYIDGSVGDAPLVVFQDSFFKDTKDLDVYILSVGHIPNAKGVDIVPSRGAVGLKIHLYEGEDRDKWSTVFRMSIDSVFDDIHLPNAVAWDGDADSHWRACVNHPNVPAAEIASHDLAPKNITDTQHTMECTTCGRTDTAPHVIRWTRSEKTHASTCDICGWTSGEQAHAFGTWQSDPARHWRECGCGTKDGEGAHDSTVCTTCGRSAKDDVVYAPLESSAQVWTYASGTDWVAEIEAPLARFTGVAIDGELLNENDLTAEQRDIVTVVSVKREVMERLRDGTHVLTVLFSDGKCEIEVEVRGSSWSAGSHGGACRTAGALMSLAILPALRRRRYARL